MRADVEKPSSLEDGTKTDPTGRLRVVIADASPGFMSVVLSLLEFHEVVDLIGRAATFEETVELVLKQQPDLILIDLDMRLANLAIPVIIFALRRLVKIIGLCTGEKVSFARSEILMTVDAVIHKERLSEDLLTVLHAHFPQYCGSVSISSPPGLDHAMNQWPSGLPLQTGH